MVRFVFRPAGTAGAVLLMLAASGGCAFSERSLPMRDGDVLHACAASALPRVSTRDWLARTHAQLAGLLPPSRHRPLVTEDLVGPDGRPVNVSRHFGLEHRDLRKLLQNWYGLSDSAQAVGAGSVPTEHVPDWPGFHDVRIPVARGVELSGRIGFAHGDGTVAVADCIVLLPGLFGDNAIFRTRDLAAALRDNGFHVLALELRGHGRTEVRHPDVYYTFGVLETLDLMRVSEWLEARPEVRRTGLIGFCWGGNLSLLAAWTDGRGPHHPSIAAALERHLPPISARPHFSAGIMALSTVFHFEELVDELETPRSFVADPIIGSLQDTVRARMALKGYPTVTHSLRTLIEREFAHSDLSYPGSVEDAYRFLRLKPYHGRSDGDKLEDARMPVLIVHAANDPLCPAQDVADLIARTDNPNVAAVVLPGGGHVGFPPYARAYYFSLVMNFFDPRCGAAAARAGALAHGSAPPARRIGAMLSPSIPGSPVRR